MKNIFKYIPAIFLLAIFISGCDDNEDIVSEDLPVAAFSANKTKIFIGESITFTDLSSGNPTSLLWNFGTIDDTTSTANPSKKFKTVGTYTITLAVSNDFGSDTLVKTDYIEVDSLILGESDTLIDIDGNIYNTIAIGDQIWMAENLKVTHFPDGTSIPLVENDSIWGSLEDNNDAFAYCYYDNISNGSYGALYTYAAAVKACPEGWHLPSDDEWKQLELYIGMYQADVDTTGWRGIDEGLKLKSSSGWAKNDGEVDFGFKALPGGYRYSTNGAFCSDTYLGYWWTSTESDDTNAYYRALSSNTDKINRDNLRGKSFGFSVRYVKD